jgi:hypothetical protein
MWSGLYRHHLIGFIGIVSHFPFAFSHAFPAARLALYSGSVANRWAFSLPGSLTGRPFRLTVHRYEAAHAAPALSAPPRKLIGIVVGHFHFGFGPGGERANLISSR